MTGGVAAILAALLRDGGAPPGLGPISCIALGCAAVFSLELAKMVTQFTTSVVYGCAFALDSFAHMPIRRRHGRCIIYSEKQAFPGQPCRVYNGRINC